MKKGYLNTIFSQKERLSFKGFTLVELIVVIAILAILGTIATMSLQGYNRNARDSVRITGIKNIESTMEFFMISSGIYPNPTDGVAVTYKGGEIWTQGTVGDSVITNLKRLNKKPVDPLTGSKYTYSRLNTKREIELGSILESGGLAYNSLITETNASDNTLAYVIGNYNGSVVKVSTGSTNYVLAVPSIIGSDLSNPNLLDIVTKKKLVYNLYSNTPSSYNGTSSYTASGGFDYNSINTGALVVYEGDINTLSNSGTVLKTFADNLITAYSGTTLESQGIYSGIVAMDTTDINQVTNLAGNIVNNSLGGSINANLGVNTSVINNKSCKKLLDSGINTDGVYTIDPENNGVGFDVYCDMTTDGGGWTLITNVINPTPVYNSSVFDLSTNFIASQSIASSIGGNSTDIRYNCERAGNIIDIKTSSSLWLTRPYSTGDACSLGYNWGPNLSFTTLPNNNYPITQNSNSGSCCCRPNHTLNTYPIGINSWVINDYYYNNWTRNCAGGSGAAYMRIWYR